MLIKWSVYCTVLYFTLLNAIHTRYRKNAYSTPLPSLGGRPARTDYLPHLIGTSPSTVGAFLGERVPVVL